MRSASKKNTQAQKTQSAVSVKPDAAEVVAPAVVPAVVVPAMYQIVSFVCGSFCCLLAPSGALIAIPTYY